MNDEINNYELGITNGDWVEAKLDELISNDGIFCDGDWVESKDQDKNGNVRLIQLADIGDGNFKDKSARFLTLEKSIELNCTYLKYDDIILARMPDPLGRATLFPLKGEKKFVTVVDVAILRIGNSFINNRYLLYNINSPFIRQKIEALQSGSTRKRISRKNLAKIDFPLAPLPIQRAIVSKIESLFSDLDNGITNLKKAQEQLKIYRQAVLKKAFEGELTKEWREKQTNLPTAEELLTQIKEERKANYELQITNWENAVKDWEKNGKEGKKPSKPQKNKSFDSLSMDKLNLLPKLPDNWFWDKLGNVCLKIMDGTHFSPKNLSKGDFKYITAKNIKEGRIVLDNISYVTKADHMEIFSRCDVKKGDVLYIKDGATTGKAAVNKLDEEFSLLSSVGVFRTSHKLILPQYLEYYLNSQVTRNRMLSNVAGVAITRLTLIKLNNSFVSLCSLAEQTQIVQEIESRLSVTDNLEFVIRNSLLKAEALRQSILKKAFEGKLLSESEIEVCKQEEDYEPASVLLQKIKAEKLAKEKKAKKTKKSKKNGR